MGSLLAALALVFLAEIGDKTQLVAMGLGARQRVGPVMAGVALGYAATNLLSVVIGGLLGVALPTRAIGLGGGVLFLAFAAWGLRASGSTEKTEAEVDKRRVVLSVAATMFVAEFGDKTMLATATLAAQGNPALVWVGATIGIILSGFLGVLVGRALGARIPERVTRIGSSVLFALFGAVLIGSNL